MLTTNPATSVPSKRRPKSQLASKSVLKNKIPAALIHTAWMTAKCFTLTTFGG